MNEFELKGCRPAPVASYLKALGVLRLVAEQADRFARGWWRAGLFVLRSELSSQELCEFFLHHYVPTPLVAPWNGRSGFRIDVDRESEKALRALEQTSDPRLTSFRDAIAIGRKVYNRATSSGWATKKDKALWVETCRAELPDAAIAWLDALVVLTDEGSTFSPLLGGSGGVFGSMDLSNNFIQHLSTVLGLSNKKGMDPIALFHDALFDEGSPPLAEAAIGQFDPGRAGENKSSPVGESIVNPWDYVLCLEGALLFASSPARRLGMDGRGKAAIPFTVDVSPVGFQTSEEESSGSAEIWTPLWERPVSLGELERLMGEGRSQWGRRQARTGLDFVRATASLGVDRGISSFVRHAVLERFGQAKLVVPVGRVDVKPKAEIPVLHQIDRWVNPIRWARERPAAVTAALHRLDAAQYEVALRGGPDRLIAVLTALAELEATVGVATTFRQKRASRPVQPLSAEAWLPHLDDGTAEFRLAASLASLRDRYVRRELTQVEQTATMLGTLLRPVRLDPRRFRLVWTGTAPAAPGLGSRPIVDVLLDAHRERVLAALAMRRERAERQGPGLRSAFDEGRWVSADDAAQFAADVLDDDQIASLLQGLLLLDWRSFPKLPDVDRRDAAAFVPPPAWALLVPFFLGRAIEFEGGVKIVLDPEASWVALLGAGRVAEVVSRALIRLRVARLEPLIVDTQAVGRTIDGKRLAAALLLPLAPMGARSLLGRVAVYEPEAERSTA